MPHPFADRWNHNSHYYPMIGALVPASARRVLDLGCGDGTLVRHLARPGRTVHGLDIDAAVLPETEPGVVFEVGSAEQLAHPRASMDAVTMVMVLHHVDAQRALAEVRRVLRPGGTAVVLGFGNDATPADRLWSTRDVVVHRWLARRRTRWEPPVAVADPALTWRQTRTLLAAELPGGRYRRLPLWRYRYVWTAPA
ncbi:hypothetical protein AGMMS50218_10680 [Actinomycetota bacterium]|nr:hypothetical protein AGMMS50218_10680 [Actinomycetota bacterium]